MIGYETAYLKAHWPTEFMAALLTSDQQNIDRISIEIEECRRMGIKVSRPDLNQSFSSFTVITSGTEKNELAGSEEIVDTIRFGLKAIKNVGENISEVIIKERKKNGPFKDISDLLERVTNKDLNKKSLESLIKSGSLDKFGERGQLLANMENLLNFSKEITKLRSNGQVSLFFDSPNINLPNKVKLDPAPKANRQESLAWEKELLGIYISEHPFSDYKKFLEDITLPLFNLAKQANDKNSICVAGIITSIKKIYTRRNEPMMFAKIEDTTGSLEVIVFPNLLKDSASIWQAGKVVICQGKLSDKDQEVKLLVNIAMELSLDNIEELIAGFKKKISNRFNYNNKNSYNYSNLSTSRKPIPDLKLMLAEGLDDSTLNRLKNILAKHSGTNKVFIKIRQGKIENILETGFRVNNNKSLIDEINKEFSHSIKVVDEL